MNKQIIKKQLDELVKDANYKFPSRIIKNEVYDVVIAFVDQCGVYPQTNKYMLKTILSGVLYTHLRRARLNPSVSGIAKMFKADPSGVTRFLNSR